MSLNKQIKRVGFLGSAIGLFALVVSGCGGGSSGGTSPVQGRYVSPGTTPFVNSAITSRAVCQANAQQTGRAKWTVLVYINAANNLQPDSLLNVAQMASVGSDGTNLNIVVQWKQADVCPYFSSVNNCGNPSFIGTHRYYILPHSQADVTAIQNGDTSSLEDAQERLPDPSTNVNGTSDMGNWQTLQNFIQWGAAHYPSDNLAVVVWDHGSGALPVLNRSAGKAIVTRAVSQDCNTGNQISTPQLAQALASPPQPIDDLVLDCSLQCTAEVAYELRNSAKVLVASEESPPGAGYPYNVWLGNLKSGSSNPCTAGQSLLNDMIAAYPGYTDITQSMIDLSQMTNVASAINSFGSALLNHVSDQTTLEYNARFNSQYFEFPEYKDLYDFADNIRTSAGVPTDLQSAAAGVETSLLGTNGAIMSFVHGSTGQTYSSGLSIYLPGPQEPSSVDTSVGYDPVYSTLALSQAAPEWPLFIQAQKQ